MTEDERTLAAAEPLSRPLLMSIRWIISVVIAIPIGILWLLVFILGAPLLMAVRLDLDKISDDFDGYWAALGRLLRIVRGNSAEGSASTSS